MTPGRRLRVLHLVNDSSIGGAQTLIEQLAKFGKAEFEVHILVLREPGLLAERLAECATSIDHLGLERSSNGLLHTLRWIRRHIRDINPDIIHTHLIHSDFCGLLASGRRPVIWTIHSTGYTSTDPIRSRVLSKVNSKLSGLVSAVVACTPEARQFAIREGYASRNLSMVSNGVDLSDPRRGSIGSRSHTFVHVARWHPMKDHRTLFKAFRIVRESFPEARLLCFGDQLSEDNLELQHMLSCEGVSDFVDLRGVTDDVRGPLIESAALLISSSYGEALPMVAIEALSVGVPVISTRVGHAESLAIAGWMIADVEDAVQLANACIKLLSAPVDMRDQIMLRARALAEENYDIKSTVNGYFAIYDQILVSE